jgi:hypothetical protein
MPLSSSNAARQLSDGNSIGTILGQSTSDVLRFYGAFGASSGVQQVSVIGSTLTAQGGFATTVAQASNSTIANTTWGFSSSTQTNMVISTMTALWQLGIIG